LLGPSVSQVILALLCMRRQAIRPNLGHNLAGEPKISSYFLDALIENTINMWEKMLINRIRSFVEKKHTLHYVSVTYVIITEAGQTVILPSYITVALAAKGLLLSKCGLHTT